MNTKKIILALYVGIIALSTLGLSFSIAWYAASSRLQVNVINMEIDADAELKISETNNILDATDKLSFDTTDRFAPVTTAHSSSWISEKTEQNPIFYDDTISLGDQFADRPFVATSGYFSKELYLFCDHDVTVTISNENLETLESETFIIPDSDKNLSQAHAIHERVKDITDESSPDYMFVGLSEEEIAERLDNLVKAMRFSILVPIEDNYQYVIVDPSKEEGDKTYLGGILDNNVDRYFDYNDLTGKERLYGEFINKEAVQYDEALSEDSSYVKEGAPSAFNAKHKKGIQRFNFEKSKEYIKAEDSHSLDEFDDHAHTPLNIPVKRDVGTRIVLSVYIEGWDLDSVNYTMGASFFAGLKFTIAKGMI